MASIDDLAARVAALPGRRVLVGITGEPSRFTARGIDVGVFTYTSMSAKNLSYQ